MNHLSQTEIIWNRACQGASSESGPGDRALAGLLLAHGYTMNGGVLHAAECLTKNEFNEAYAGYKFYDLGSVASILTLARIIVNSTADQEHFEAYLDGKYHEEIPDDSFLYTKFLNHFRENPSDYDPIEGLSQNG